MKSIFTLITLLTLSFSVISAQSEKSIFPERLTLLLNNDVKMVIESREILKIPQSPKEETLFKNMISNIDMVKDSLQKLNAPLLITYATIGDGSQKLNVAFKNDTKAEFIFKGSSDTVSSSFFNYTIECELGMSDKLTLYTNNLSTLSGLRDFSYTDIIGQAKADVASHKISNFKAKTCVYKVTNNKLDVASGEVKKQAMVMIMCGVDFGLSYVNGQFLPNISGSIGYTFSQKTRRVSKIGLAGEVFYNMDPNANFQLESNTFVDGFFNMKQTNHPFYYAKDLTVFGGYLVKRGGVVFPNNCWRFGLDMPAGEHFRIQYVVYGGNTKESGMFEIGIKYRFF